MHFCQFAYSCVNIKVFVKNEEQTSRVLKEFKQVDDAKGSQKGFEHVHPEVPISTTYIYVSIADITRGLCIIISPVYQRTVNYK